MLTRSGGKVCFPCGHFPPEKGFQSIPRGSAERCRPKTCLCFSALALPLGVPICTCPPAQRWVFVSEGAMGFLQLMTQWCVKTSFSKETQRGKQRHARREGHTKAGEELSWGFPRVSLDDPYALSRCIAAGSRSTLRFQKSPKRLKSPEVMQTTWVPFFHTVLVFF